jgi:pyridinium-3,5-biscarboxylic acid mononucleotide sulfurtransferase
MSSQESVAIVVQDQCERLVALIRAMGSRVVVAFSGGVDSAVVASAAYRALGVNAVAWTGVGAAVPESDRRAAVEVARAIGIEHVMVPTDEMSRDGYVSNGPDRCYHCKTTLYSSIARWVGDRSMGVILSGTNAEDLGDYRPGLRAATEWGVRAPLAELGYGKEEVRAIAREWGISIASKPASPCLASRIAYGQVVTLGRLNQVESMERWLIEEGFRDVRARLHGEQLLRLEIHLDEFPMVLREGVRERLLQKALGLGFRYVTMDLQGRSSGSMNRGIVSE